MTNDALNSIPRLLQAHSLQTASDAELVRRFVAVNDEAAFRVIAERHGPMVLGVCQRALKCRHDADDAFQATFLVFARKAGSIRKSESLASWLHGAARRVSTTLRRRRSRRARHEQSAAPLRVLDPVEELTWAEVKAGLDDELLRLPPRYRDVLVLCYLEAMTRDEAARQLGLTPGALHGRLERARKLLADRLTTGGLTLSAGLLAIAVSPSTVSATVHAASLFARNQSLAEVVSPGVLSLAKEVLKGMVMSQVQKLCLIAVAAVVAAAGVGLGLAQEKPLPVPGDGQPPAPAARNAEQPVEKTDEVTQQLFEQYVARQGRINTESVMAATHLVAERGRTTGFWKTVLLELRRNNERSEIGCVRVLGRMLATDAAARDAIRRQKETGEISAWRPSVHLGQEVVTELIERGSKADRFRIDHYTIALARARVPEARDFFKSVLSAATAGETTLAGQTARPGGPTKGTTPDLPPAKPADTVPAHAYHLEGTRFHAAVGLAQLGDAEGIDWLIAHCEHDQGSVTNAVPLGARRGGSLDACCVEALRQLSGKSNLTGKADWLEWSKSVEKKGLLDRAVTFSDP